MSAAESSSSSISASFSRVDVDSFIGTNERKVFQYLSEYRNGGVVCQTTHPLTIMLLGIGNLLVLDVINSSGLPNFKKNDDPSSKVYVPRVLFALQKSSAANPTYAAFSPESDKLLPAAFKLAFQYVCSRSSLSSIYTCSAISPREFRDFVDGELVPRTNADDDVDMTAGSSKKASGKKRSLRQLQTVADDDKKTLLTKSLAGELSPHYKILEVAVLPFIMRYILDANQSFICASVQSLLVIAVLAEITWLFGIYSAPADKRPTTERDVDDFIQNYDVSKDVSTQLRRFVRRVAGELHRIGILNESWKNAIITTWREMTTSTDILNISSVLFMPTSRTVNEWYMRLLMLEKLSKVDIFPLIRVERAMEIKDRYLSHFMMAAEYITIKCKVENYEKNSININNMEDRKKSLLGPEYTELECLQKVIMTAAGVSIPEIPFIFHHRPHNTHLGPTVIITAAELLKHNRIRRLYAIRVIMRALTMEAEEAGFEVMPGQYFVKGCNSTRGSSSDIFAYAELIDDFMMKNSSIELLMSSADTIFERECPFVQDGYIIQPYLLCLDWEARMFMYRGVLMSGVITSRTVGGKMNVLDIVNVGNEHGNEDGKEDEAGLSQSSSADDDVGHMIIRKKYHSILTHIIDFVTHICAHLETYNSLLTKSGMVRIDVGVQYHDSTAVPKPSFKVDSATLASSPWIEYEVGKFCRIIMNEATTTTDINPFLKQKRPPLSAAFAWKFSVASLYSMIGVRELRGSADKIANIPERMQDDPPTTFSADGFNFGALPVATIPAVETSITRLTREPLFNFPVNFDLKNDHPAWSVIKAKGIICATKTEFELQSWNEEIDDDVYSYAPAEDIDQAAAAASSSSPVLFEDFKTKQRIDVSKILPRSSVRTWQLDPGLAENSAFQSYETFLEEFGGSKGRLIEYKFVDELWTQMPAVSGNSCTVQQWSDEKLKPYLAKMERDNECVINSVFYLVDIVIPAAHPSLVSLRENSPIMLTADYDGTMTLNRYLFLAHPLLKTPDVGYHGYLSMPTNGLIVTPFHADGAGSQTAIHFVPFGQDSANRIYAIRGGGSAEQQDRVRYNAGMPLASDPLQLPHSHRHVFDPKKIDSTVGMTPSFKGPDAAQPYHPGFHITDLFVGCAAFLPAGTPHGFAKILLLEEDGKAVKIDKKSSPMLGLACDSTFIGDDELTTKASVENCKLAASTCRFFKRPSLCYPDIAINGMAQLFHEQKGGQIPTIRQLCGIRGSLKSYRDLENSIDGSHVAKCISQEAAYKDDWICSGCRGEMVNLFATVTTGSHESYHCAYCINNMLGIPEFPLVLHCRFYTYADLNKHYKTVETAVKKYKAPAKKN